MRRKPGPKSRVIPTTELSRLYVNEQRSAHYLTTHFGVSEKTIYKWLRAVGVRIRDCAQASRIGKRQNRQRPTSEELYRLYVDEGMSRKAIADQWGIDASVVTRWLEDDGIPVRRRANSDACLICGQPREGGPRMRRDCCWWPCFDFFEQAGFDLDLARLIHAHNELRRTIRDVGR